MKREHSPSEGPRVPLRWGSACTQICVRCGMWREDMRTGVGATLWGRWKSAKLLRKRLLEDE